MVITAQRAPDHSTIAEFPAGGPAASSFAPSARQPDIEPANLLANDGGAVAATQEPAH
jgi:hypothetical protein